MEEVFMCQLRDLDDSQYESPFITKNNVDEERNPLTELFPDTLAESLNTLEQVDFIDYYPDYKFQLFGGLVMMESDVGFYPQPEIIQLQPDNLVAKPEPKKRGRPRKNKTSPVAVSIPVPIPVAMPAEPICKTEPFELSPFERKKKKRKCMTQVEKAQHNHLERERRKGMTSLLERLRELVPAVSYDKKASQKKIVDEATVYLREEKPTFLAFLKERQRFLSLERRKRQLEYELASKRKGGCLCVWEERRGMSAGDLYKKVKKEALEDIQDEQTDKAIRVLESYRYRSPESSPSHSGSSSPSSSADSDEDDDDDEHINVEV